MVTNLSDLAPYLADTDYLFAVAASPVASFLVTPSAGSAPLAVTFTDTSTGAITNWFWSFGDGTTTNTVSTNVVHPYTVAGTNTVTLIVTGPSGSSTNSQLRAVIVSLPSSTVTAPRILPAGGTFITAALKVTLSCTGAGATIRYTTNGTDPTTNSTAYARTAVTLTNSVTLKAKAFTLNGASGITTAVFTLLVPPAIVTTSLPRAIQQQSYTATLGVAGGVAPYTWALATGSRLPLGLTLNTTTGVITGIPTRAGLDRFAVIVTDANHRRAIKSLAVTVGN